MKVYLDHSRVRRNRQFVETWIAGRRFPFKDHGQSYSCDRALYACDQIEKLFGGGERRNKNV